MTEAEKETCAEAADRGNRIALLCRMTGVHVHGIRLSKIWRELQKKQPERWAWHRGRTDAHVRR